MSDAQLSFRKSANIDRVTDKRKDSLFRLVDTDGSGSIDAQEFAVLYDAIKKDLAEELEKEAELQREASSARRRFKMLLLFVAVLVSFLAASVAANFAVMFTVVDQAITTRTSSSGIIEVKGSDTIAKMALATQDVPLAAAPALDMDTLAQVKSVQITYQLNVDENTEAQLAVVAVRKHNATFAEFVTDVPGETVEVLNGVASLVRFTAEGDAQKIRVCSANATCSAFRVSGIDVDATVALAKEELVKAGFGDAVRRLGPYMVGSCTGGNWAYEHHCGYTYTALGTWTLSGTCFGGALDDVAAFYGHPNPHYGAAPPGAAHLSSIWYDSSSYTAARHVVVLAHGKGMDYAQMWNVWCTPCSFNPPCYSCPNLELPQFKHLVFVFAGSGVWDAGFQSHGWSADVLASDYTLASATYSDVTTGMLAVIEQDLGDIFKHDTEIMWVGFSDGGGMGMYAHYLDLFEQPNVPFADCNSRSGITKVLALDYWAGADYATWLQLATSAPKMNAKIFSNCESFTYTADLGQALFDEQVPNIPDTMPTGMNANTFSSYYIGYAQHDYHLYKMERKVGGQVCSKIHWFVHALDPTFSPDPLLAYPGQHNYWADACDPGQQTMTHNGDPHAGMLVNTPVIGEVMDWVHNPNIASPSGPTLAYKFNRCNMLRYPGHALRDQIAAIQAALAAIRGGGGRRLEHTGVASLERWKEQAKALADRTDTIMEGTEYLPLRTLAEMSKFKTSNFAPKKGGAAMGAVERSAKAIQMNDKKREYFFEQKLSMKKKDLKAAEGTRLGSEIEFEWNADYKEDPISCTAPILYEEGRHVASMMYLPDKIAALWGTEVMPKPQFRREEAHMQCSSA